MPSFAIDTVVPDSADAIHVALNARLEFVAGASSDTMYALKGRVPDDVDVILQSDLVISIAGMVNRLKVDARALQSSAVAQHLQNYLRMVRIIALPPYSRVFATAIPVFTRLIYRRTANSLA